jgi:septal ring factor EnvC (AmiA/AmiB activator)
MCNLFIQIHEIQDRISSKKTEIENAIESRKQLEDQLVKIVAESNKHEEILTKIYRKKVKRKRRKENPLRAANGPKTDQDDEENPVQEFSDEDEDEDDSESEDSESDGAEISDDCPPGCDSAVHTEVLRLREQRLDLEDHLNEVQKSIEASKKDNEICGKKEKVIASALKQAEQEIQEFQTQKQQRLNELDMVVCVYFH